MLPRFLFQLTVSVFRWRFHCSIFSSKVTQPCMSVVIEWYLHLFTGPRACETINVWHCRSQHTSVINLLPLFIGREVCLIYSVNDYQMALATGQINIYVEERRGEEWSGREQLRGIAVRVIGMKSFKYKDTFGGNGSQLFRFTVPSRVFVVGCNRSRPHTIGILPIRGSSGPSQKFRNRSSTSMTNCGIGIENRCNGFTIM